MQEPIQDGYDKSPGSTHNGTSSKSEEQPEPTIPDTEQKPKQTTTPSIKDALNSIRKKADSQPSSGQDDAAVHADENTQVKEIDKELLLKKWDEYVEKIKSESPRMYLSLGSQEPFLSEDGFTLNIEFRNNALVDEFKKQHKTDLLSFLRNELNLDSIEIKEVILEAEEQSKARYYTDLDKLKYMIEKNPALQKLRQDFNLDFE